MEIDSSENLANNLEWTKFGIEKGFAALEKLLRVSSVEYWIWNELNFADCFLLSQIAQAIRFKVNICHSS